MRLPAEIPARVSQLAVSFVMHTITQCHTDVIRGTCLLLLLLLLQLALGRLAKTALSAGPGDSTFIVCGRYLDAQLRQYGVHVLQLFLL